MDRRRRKVLPVEEWSSRRRCRSRMMAEEALLLSIQYNQKKKKLFVINSLQENKGTSKANTTLGRSLAR